MPFVGSTAALGAGASWTSNAMQTGTSDRITGIVFADQGGTIYIEQSMDGANWDLNANYAVPASTGKGFSEELVAPQVRIRYVNGGTPQTVFRIASRFTSAGPR